VRVHDVHGIWDGEHLELIDGELINKMGTNDPHLWTVALLHEWLIAAFGFWCVLKEDPINVAPEDNEHVNRSRTWWFCANLEAALK